jgi:hypothetical protein
MPRARANRWAWVVACGALALGLLACAGPALLARRSPLPSLAAEVPIWPGTSLALRHGTARNCLPQARCPRRIGRQPGLSIWLTWQVRRRGNTDVIGRRMLFLRASE